MIVNLLIVLVVFVIVFVVVVALRPADFRVTRSTLISAPPAVVFTQVNDLHIWQEFSPWAKMDPAAKTTFEGPVAGKGAVFTWDGNKQIGAGRMTIIESVPSELIRFQMNFHKPFESSSTVEFTFKTEGAQTLVTWNMFGKNNFMFRAAGLFMNCDKMVGGQFEEGLANLKVLSESKAR